MEDEEFGQAPEQPTQDAFVSDNSQGQQQDNNWNPKWDTYMQGVPEGLREFIAPAFSAWDKDVNKAFRDRAEQAKQYEGYAPFVQQGISPADLAAGYNMFNALQNDPVKVFEALREQLVESGYSINEATQIAQEAVNDDDPTDDPRFAQLQGQQEQILGYIEQQHQAQLQEQASTELANEWAELQQRFPDLDSTAHREAIVRTLAIAQANPNRVVSLSEGLAEYLQLKKSILSQRPGNSAPAVVGGNGGNGQVPPKQYGGMSEAEFKQDTVNALRQAFGG